MKKRKRQKKRDPKTYFRVSYQKKALAFQVAESTFAALETEAERMRVPVTGLARYLIETGLGLTEPGMYHADWQMWPQECQHNYY